MVHAKKGEKNVTKQEKKGGASVYERSGRDVNGACEEG